MVVKLVEMDSRKKKTGGTNGAIQIEGMVTRLKWHFTCAYPNVIAHNKMSTRGLIADKEALS